MLDSVELRSNAANCRRAVHEMAAKLINHVAHAVKDDAVEAAPEKTGNLKSLIAVKKEATAGDPDASLESGASYSDAVNFGYHAPDGSFVAANPFMTSAIERAPIYAAEAADNLGA